MTTAVEVAEKGHQLAAWVNFDGTGGAANKSGTYSQSGTTITFTFSTDHDLVVGSVMLISFSSGAATQETFTVATVPSSTVMTATSVSSRTTSGNFTAYYQTIRASFNVSSISENATGNFTINFATAIPANYVAVGNHNVPSSGAASVVFGYDYPAFYSTTQLQLTCFYGTVGYRVDSSRVTVAVFR
jgi:hypothetical protein